MTEQARAFGVRKATWRAVLAGLAVPVIPMALVNLNLYLDHPLLRLSGKAWVSWVLRELPGVLCTLVLCGGY
ncbi:MAG: hypothetical protein ACYS5V_01700 [Planctomycetota bacterium]|jgi:hypothetical protein